MIVDPIRRFMPLACFALYCLTNSPVYAQLPTNNYPNSAPTASGDVASQPNSLATADNFSSRQPVQTFVDPRSGQMYGRYVVFENVPVATYEYREVTEKQWVPEWVQETKLTTQINYVPVVTYQLQQKAASSLNPFAVPRQYWEYVPIVQYQANPVQVNQPITYQKYVEKEFTKRVPVMVTKQQQVPRFADQPLGNPVANTSVPQTFAPNANITRFPTSPIDYPAYPNQALAQQAPPAYYTSQPSSAPTTNTGLANIPAYSPTGIAPSMMAGQNNRAGVPMAATPYLNNPSPNYGLAAAGMNQPPYYPANAANNPYNYAVAARPTFQLPNLFSRTGALFQGGLLPSNRNNSSSSAYVAALPSSNGVGYASPNGTTPTNSLWGTALNPNGISFRSSAPNNMTPPNNNGWNLTPVNNYRDPSQGGLPATYLR